MGQQQNALENILKFPQLMTHKQFVNDIVTAFLTDAVAQLDTREGRLSSGHAFHCCAEQRGARRAHPEAQGAMGTGLLLDSVEPGKAEVPQRIPCG